MLPKLMVFQKEEVTLTEVLQEASDTSIFCLLQILLAQEFAFVVVRQTLYLPAFE